MDELTSDAGVDSDRLPRLSDRVEQLRKTWDRAVSSYLCRDGEGWGGQIDQPLGDLLVELHAFFEKSATESETRRRSSFHVQRALDPTGEPLPQNEQSRRSRWWMDVYREFNALLHGSTAHARPDEFRALLERLEILLVDMLDPPPSVNFPRLQTLLAVPVPTQKDIDRLERLVRSRADERHFFGSLEHPGWLRPLTEAGWFLHPPSANKVGQDPGWPQLEYLRRTAPAHPEETLKALLLVPETDNVWVRSGIADVALSLPAEHTATWSQREAVRLSSQERAYGPRPLALAQVVAHLANGGQAEAAFVLAAPLLALTRVEESRPIAGFVDRRPAPRYEPILYSSVVGCCGPALVNADPDGALEFFAELLDTAMRISAGIAPDDERPPVRDSSYISIPCLEPGDTSVVTTNSVITSLAFAVRDAASAAANAGGPDAVRGVVARLEEGRWDLFRRLALHLMRCYPDGLSDLIAAHLRDRQLFDEPRPRRELVLLAQEQFSRIPPDDQRHLLEWILAGPTAEDAEEFVEQSRALNSRPPSEQVLQDYRDRWVLVRLFRLDGALPPEAQLLLDQLRARLGEPHESELGIWERTGVGDLSPCSTEELTAMPVDEIVEVLRNWQSDGDPFGTSETGLSRELAQAVHKSPHAFAKEALRFGDLHYRYIQALLVGLRRAADDDEQFGWPAVLDLCLRITERCQPVGQTGTAMAPPPREKECLKAVASLLTAGLGATESAIPQTSRGPVLQVLGMLAEYPDPEFHPSECDTSYAESEYEITHGPYVQSINTVRGQAMHALFHYARWVKVSVGWESLAQIHEVSAIVERHLDPGYDGAPAIRATYGHWFRWLHCMDPAWSGKNWALVFPEEDDDGPLRLAAWDGYCHVGYERLAEPCFRLLRPVYAWAVRNLAQQQHRSPPTFLARVLVHHLMIAYCRGWIQLDSPVELLPGFYASGSDEVAAEAIHFVGQDLSGQPPDPNDDAVVRLRLLWQARAASHFGQDPPASPKEVEAFGWWFISGAFPEDWSLDQLLAALTVTGCTEMEVAVVERLATLVEERPQEVLRCLEQLVRGDQEGWRPMEWRDPARRILAACMASSDVGLSAQAQHLLDWLVSRGYTGYEDLLPGS